MNTKAENIRRAIQAQRERVKMDKALRDLDQVMAEWKAPMWSARELYGRPVEYWNLPTIV